MEGEQEEQEAQSPTSSPTTAIQEVQSGPNVDTKYRVKIYEMMDTGNWLDKGTGHVQCTFMGVGYSLVVRSETDGSSVLVSKILMVEYKQQQDSLIIWHDENGQDLALSFQDQSGCLDIWEQIEELQKRMAADHHDIDNIAGFNNTQEEEEADSTFQLQPDFQLPEATVKNLEDLEKIFCIAVKSMATRETLLKIILETDFLETFIELLEQCEDLEMLTECYQMSTIVKCLYYLNNSALFNLMLQDPYFMILLGMLEYDREYPTVKAYYRDFFKDQVVTLTNLDLVTQITRVFRANYMKDVALARTIEDSTFNALNTLVYQNTHEIIQSVSIDEALLQKIIALSHQGNKDANSFLQELFVMAKTFSKDVQTSLFKALARQGLFDNAMVADDLDVLYCVLEHSPLPIRKLILTNQNEATPLLQKLIDRLKSDSEDDGVKIQIIEIFRLLLDTTGVAAAVSTPLSIETRELDKFLTLFYEKYADPLFNILFSPPKETAQSASMDTLTTMLLDLLCFFITQNAMFCKNYLLTSTIFKKICTFLVASSGRKLFVRLAALRVFKVCLSMNDEFYRRLLMKQEVLGKIVTCLLETGGKNNLLNSACLEFFEIIRTGDGMKSIIIHIVSQFRSEFKQIQQHVVTLLFDQLIQMFDEFESASLQPPKSATGAASGNYVKKDGYDKVDHTEEAYFLKDDDEDDQPAQPQQHTTISPDSVKKSLGSLEFVSGGMLHSNLDTTPPSNQAVKEAATSSDPLPPQIKLVPYEVGSDSSDSEDELSIGVRKRSLQTAGFGSGGGSGLGSGKKIAINLKSSGSKVAEKNGASSPESSAKRRKLI